MSSLVLTFQSVNEQLDKVQAQLQEELRNVSSLQAKVAELEVCVFLQSNVMYRYIICTYWW